MKKAAKKALVKRLAVAANFDPAAIVTGRAWFVYRAIEAQEERGTPDAQIPKAVEDLLAKATKVVAAERDAFLKLGAHTTHPRSWAGGVTRRVEILYGAIALRPELAEPANIDLLRLTAARRYRGIIRMGWWVAGGMCFWYPGACPGSNEMQLNEDAQPHWEEAFPKDPFYWKSKAVAPATTPNYVDAVSTIFNLKGNPCKGNLTECALAAGSVLLDTLLEAKDPTRLLTELDKRPNYLLLAHPHRLDITYLLHDMGPSRVFDKVQIPEHKLQVGDHVYVNNHPSYLAFAPRGAWAGEHAFVMVAGDRTSNRLHVEGHGLKIQTASSMVDELLKATQTFQHRTYLRAITFFEYMRTGGTSVPASKVFKTVRTIKNPMTDTSIDADRYEFHVPIDYPDYRETPSGETRKPNTSSGFTVFHMPSINWVILANQDEDKQTPLGARLQRALNLNGADGWDPLIWKLVYYNVLEKQIESLNMFRKVGGAVTIKLIERKDMPPGVYGLQLDTTKEGHVVSRPNDDPGSANLSFLRSVGAL